MDIRTLRYFLVTAQERNFTKAANKLCMAQPPLSRQIKLLEEELGVTLFIRNSRQLQLTEEDYFLKQQAEEILLLIEKTEHQLEKWEPMTMAPFRLEQPKAAVAAFYRI